MEDSSMRLLHCKKNYVYGFLYESGDPTDPPCAANEAQCSSTKWAWYRNTVHQCILLLNHQHLAEEKDFECNSIPNWEPVQCLVVWNLLEFWLVWHNLGITIRLTEAGEFVNSADLQELCCNSPKCVRMKEWLRFATALILRTESSSLGN